MKGYSYPGESPIKQQTFTSKKPMRNPREGGRTPEEQKRFETEAQPVFDAHRQASESLKSIKTKHYNTLESFKKMGMKESHMDYQKVLSQIKGVRADIKTHTTLPSKRYPSLSYKPDKKTGKPVLHHTYKKQENK